jgi:glycosyltransferase involved in cell wall biosynthesis
VHVHSVPDFLVVEAALPKLLGTPIILDIHDILPEFYASKFNLSQDSLLFKLLLLLERWSIAFSDHVIVANHLWHQRLLTRSASAEKCTPICNYPDPQLFSRRPRRRTDGKFVITYPGTLNWHQGLDIAIKAFRKVLDQIPDAEFHIYGEGPAKPSLIRLAEHVGLCGKVRFYDPLPLGHVAEVMADSDLAVVPKRASAFGNEAASTKIPEFMAVGIPVIVSRTKVDTYYYDDSLVKFFDPENEADLADSIVLLQRDRQLRDQLVSNAAKYVEHNTWQVRKQEYLDLVDSLVGARVCGRKGELRC